jgi:nitrite reductase/ring-hydroxylating ferredoxin subunit
MGSPSRRQFVIGVVAAAGCAACGMSSDALAAAAAPVPVPVGTLGDYAADGVYDTYARANKFFVIRAEGRLFAASTVCPHKRNLVRKVGGELVCPAHGSKFTEQGTPLNGPAKSALPRHAITFGPDGTLTVDPSQSFGERDWEKPETFVAIP